MKRVSRDSDAHKKGRPRTVEDREAILAALRRGCPVQTAARLGGVAYSTVLERLAGDDGFRQAFDEARAEGRERRADELEAVLYEGAMKVATDPRYTGAAIFALCNLDPEHWRNRQHQRVEVQEQVEHDVGDSLLAVLESIAGGPADGAGERPEALVGRGNAALPTTPATTALAGPGGEG